MGSLAMNKQKITAIIQARMGSSRLPRNALMPLARKPVLWWMINRILSTELVDDVIIATTDSKLNKPINEFCDYYFLNSNIVKVFNYTGNENDVIGRVIEAARQNNTDIIVDVTGDCPLIDPRHIDFLINQLLENDIDYASNCIERSWPDGFDIQVYYTDTLEECKNIFHPVHHVGVNIGWNPEYFAVLNWVAHSEMHYPSWGLTLDTQQDYELLKIIFEKFSGDIFFKVEDVVKYINKNPELLKINSDVRRKAPEEG